MRRSSRPHELPLYAVALVLAAAGLTAAAADSKLLFCSYEVPCRNNGTCEVNTGYCSCMLGFGGPLCERMLFPACRTTLEASPLGFPPAMRCYHYGAKSCACLKQCAEREYVAGFAQPQTHPCFAREGVSPDDDISDVPENPEKERARFFRDASMAEEIRPEDLREQSRGSLRVLPRSACPGKCSGEGECVSAGAAAAAEEPRCVCHLGFTGADCSQPVPQCYSGCSGKGTCIRGVCSCHPGWFGLDCSVDLSRRAWLPGGGMTVMTDPPFGRFESAPAPLPERSPDPESQRLDPRRRNRLKVKIWIVETPPWLGEGLERDTEPQAGGFDDIYSAGRRFLHTLLRDKSVRTDNPHAANFFLFPTDNWAFSGSTKDPHANMRRFVRFMQANYPAMYQRNQGADFLFWALSDPGACPLPDDLRRVTWLTHFGLTNYSLLRPDVAKHNDTCFHPDHGVVVNPFFPGLQRHGDETYAAGANWTRDFFFFFAGGLNPQWRQFSQGVRADVAAHHSKREGWLIVDSCGGECAGVPVLATMRRARFCLAPTGSGWGIRLVQAMASGCVPVIIQDQVHQASEDVLPYHEFSVRVPRADIPFLNDTLAAVTDEQYARLQEGMRKHYRYFAWDEEGRAGTGHAYDLVVKSLQRQLWKVLSKIDFPTG